MRCGCFYSKGDATANHHSATLSYMLPKYNARSQLWLSRHALLGHYGVGMIYGIKPSALVQVPIIPPGPKGLGLGA